MPEVQSVSRLTQLGVETTPGTAVPANRLLQSVSFEIQPQAEVNQFRPSGSLVPTVSALGKEWMQASIKGQPTYTELIYLLAGVLVSANPTVPGGATTARQWQFDPAAFTANTVKTYTLEQGDPTTRAQKFAYGLITELGLEFTRSKIDLSGAMMGQRITDNVQMSTNAIQTLTITGAPTGGTFTLTHSLGTTAAIVYNATATAVQTALEGVLGVGNVVCTGGALPGTGVVIEFRGAQGRRPQSALTFANSLTGGTSPTPVIAASTQVGVAPTTLALIPVLPTQTSIYLADTAAGLAGASAITRGFKASWKVGDRFSPVWPLDASQPSYAAHVEKPISASAQLQLSADAVGMGLIGQMRSGATKFMRIQSVGDLIESGQSYTLTIDVAGQLSKAPDLGDTDGIYATTWDFTQVYDATWGKFTSVVVKNAIATL